MQDTGAPGILILQDTGAPQPLSVVSIGEHTPIVYLYLSQPSLIGPKKGMHQGHTISEPVDLLGKYTPKILTMTKDNTTNPFLDTHTNNEILSTGTTTILQYTQVDDTPTESSEQRSMCFQILI